MANVRCNTFLVLLTVTSVAAIAAFSLASRLSLSSSAAPELNVVEINPDWFYMDARGKNISYGFRYDPHAADDWLFRTAEGSMAHLHQIPSRDTNQTEVPVR